ncbi:MAG: Chemotaxis protein methyltransferase [Deltaproteobacteria bacterium ADurb.Bin510]|nr:MAG: Chemotaxis protein methyltransferase [Deltaproteobacteria bacterium ADurb.Bin510]
MSLPCSVSSSGRPGLSLGQPELTSALFEKLSEFIYAESGIRLPAAKRTMLSARLYKRLRELKLESLEAYCQYLFSPAGQEAEIVSLLDVVSTNKTDFFREPRHFEFLSRQALPQLAAEARPLNVWSAACSSGEEVYTLAMVLSEYAERQADFDYRILGTDISTRVLEIARTGVYDTARVEPIPHELKLKYLMRSKRGDGRYRVVPELRARTGFRRLNFMEPDFGLREQMDVIFCRNVLIYFDRATQERVLQHLCLHLKPGGYLFTGHSESTSGLRLPIQPVAASVGRRL